MRVFGDLEAVVMNLIWDRDGEAGTVRELYEFLRQDREIAYTTVMSTMDNLHRKGWLSRVREGKAYLYQPTLTREEHGAALMREALSTGGRTDVVLTHFIEQMTEAEARVLRRALRDAAAAQQSS